MRKKRNLSVTFDGFRNGGLFSRVVNSICAFAIAWLTLYPTLLAAQEAIEEQRAGSLDKLATDQLAEILDDLTDSIGVIEQMSPNQSGLAATWRDIDKQLSEFSDVGASVNDEFDRIGTFIEAIDLPRSIKRRHANAQSQYNESQAKVASSLQDIRDTQDEKLRKAKIVEFRRWLGGLKTQRSQQYLDAERLPNKTLPRKSHGRPRITALDYAWDNPLGNVSTLTANTGSTTPDGQNAFDNPVWVEQSDEIDFSQEIESKAMELQNDPLRIYHWVRNNIEWNPDWGAKQSATLTLQLGSGNAFDIASLTIALLRVSNTPARYVHGTIDVSEEVFRNWAGGFESIDAAIEYAASAGIPIAPVVSGGNVSKVRLEHVWVEVAVDFIPSRGSKSVEPDSWIAIDPSFKEYDYVEGVDASTIVSGDVTALATQYLDSGTVNEAEGWVSGFDSTLLDVLQQQGQQMVDDYVSSITEPNESDLIGDRRVVVQESPSFGASLPYQTIVRGDVLSSIPSALQQEISFALNTSATGELLNALTLPWSTVNGKRILLRFTPATNDDEFALLAFIDAQNDPELLPVILPAYLISVVPELRLGNETVITGSPMILGEEIDFRFNPKIVGVGVFENRYSVLAGSLLSIAAISNNVADSTFEQLIARAQTTSLVLDTVTEEDQKGLTRDDVVGDLFFSATLGYYKQYSALGLAMTSQVSGYQHLVAGLGSFGYEPKANFLFGVANSISPGGAFANLPMLRVVGVDSDSERQLAKSQLNSNLGLLSSVLEHTVPEQILRIGSSTPVGFSASRALQIANSEGQRLYRVTQSNLSAALLQLNLEPETESEIELSVLSGKEVFTHTDLVSVPGYTGSGYIIYDPITGDGAYKIGGGANGGFAELPASNQAGIGDEIWQWVVLILQKTVLDVVDTAKSLYQNISAVTGVCDGSLLFSAILLVSTFTILGFAAPFALGVPFVAGLLFALVYGFALNKLVEAQLNFCRN